MKEWSCPSLVLNDYCFLFLKFFTNEIVVVPDSGPKCLFFLFKKKLRYRLLIKDVIVGTKNKQ